MVRRAGLPRIGEISHALRKAAIAISRSGSAVSPNSAAMVAVSVRTESKMLCGIWTAWPVAMSTAMVSPTAREIPRMNEAMMPERAAGMTTFAATSNLVAPNPYAPSRSARGTALIASSLSEETIGMIMIPITKPALAALKMLTLSVPKIARSSGVTLVSAK